MFYYDNVLIKLRINIYFYEDIFNMRYVEMIST